MSVLSWAWIQRRGKLQRKIIAIKRKGQKRPKRLITFTDKSVFEISEDVFISIALEIGSEVDDEYLVELEEKENMHQALHAALSLLNYRMRSTAELYKRLTEKGYNPDIVERVIEKLNEKKFLDDEAFARAFMIKSIPVYSGLLHCAVNCFRTNWIRKLLKNYCNKPMQKCLKKNWWND